MTADDGDPAQSADPDGLVEYYLGADGPDSDPTARVADDRRTRRGALIGLAVVVVVVAVAITLTSLFVDTSSSTGRGPQVAARKWAAALLDGDTAARHRLECAKGSTTAGTAQLALAAATGVSTGPVHQLGTGRWSVPLDIDGPDGSPQDSVTVTVVREAGRYLVC